MSSKPSPPPTHTWNSGDNDALTEAGRQLEPELSALLEPPQLPDELGRLGAYRVLGLLGAGGMGVVFRAEDVQAGRLVAVKVMRPALASSPDMRERFLREARAVARLDHDHVVPLFHVGEFVAGGQTVPFLVMPLLRGETLAARLKRERRLPPGEVVRLGAQIASALAAAHEAGLVHRDVKPANVWLEQRGEPPRVRLLDFGLARDGQADGLTQVGLVVGTPGYVAPEQAAGLPLDARADLFSLGCVLFAMATGKPPFHAPSVRESKASEIPAAALARAQLPPAVADLILRLLAADPDQRPGSAAEVRQALGSDPTRSGTATALARRAARGSRSGGSVRGCRHRLGIRQ